MLVAKVLQTQVANSGGTAVFWYTPPSLFQILFDYKRNISF